MYIRVKYEYIKKKIKTKRGKEKIWKKKKAFGKRVIDFLSGSVHSRITGFTESRYRVCEGSS
jgi:hypothetical protein